MSADPGKSEHADETRGPVEGSPVEPAGGRRRLVEIRCGFAEMARKEADAAAVRVVEAKHLYDGQAAVIAQAEAAIDPAATHAAKDESHRKFRAAVAAARGRAGVEDAAATWLAEINRINGHGRVAQASVKREREVAEALLSQLTKVTDTAESSEAMADAAMQACGAARAALDSAGDTEPVVAVTDTRAPRPEPEAPPKPPDAPPRLQATAASPAAAAGSRPDEAQQSTDWLVIDIRSPEPQAIIGLIRRDSRVFGTLVDRLAGTDPTARSCWQILLSDFVDAVSAAAIEDAFLEFPAGDPFWSQFGAAESREIARGLAALGFRFDGFGSFAEGRVPTQRDLALAVGSAGLLPVRVRYWPKQEETEHLFRGVRASADTFIAARAPGLTLGELVRLLGRRAEHLADIWNDWPRVRPLLFLTTV